MMYATKPLERAEQYRSMAAGFRRAIPGCTNDAVKKNYRQLAASYDQLARSVEHLYAIGVERPDPKDH